MLPLALLLVAGSAFLCVYAFSASLRTESDSGMKRLEAYDRRSLRRLELERPAGERLAGPTVTHLAGAARILTPSARLGRLSRRVERAGRPYGLDLNTLLALKIIFLVLGLVLLAAASGIRAIPALAFLPLSAALLVVAYYLPELVLSRWAKSRRRIISRGLPDFLDLLTVTVEAGLGLDAALARIAEKLQGPLKEEILITLHHMRIGQSREEALREFASRCEVPDLDRFISTLIQSQRLGVGLAQILRTQSEHIRTVKRQRIEEAGRKAPTKMLFPLVLCIFPVLFVVMLGPVLITVIEFAREHM